MYETSAGAIVFRREKQKTLYLLLHYEAGHWDFPKGNIEKGESKQETVVREVKEETGITDIKFIPGFEEKIKYFYRKENTLVHKEVYFFLCETHETEIKLSSEHTGFVWLDYKRALEKITYPSSKEILKKAHSFLNKKSIADFLEK